MIVQPSSEAVERELRRRAGPRMGCFLEQADAMDDPASHRLWQCDRRAGKTTTAVCEFYSEGKQRDSEYAYIALTQKSAKRIAWRMLRQLNVRYDCRARLYEQEHRVLLPSGSILSLYGADRPGWSDLIYGQRLRRVYIDEAAFFSIDLNQLIMDVLDPCVADEEGTITLMSRPGHVNAGFFYDIAHGKIGGWSVKKWSWRDNPHVAPQIQKRIDQQLKERPELINNPSFRRNWYNEWAVSRGAHVYLIDVDSCAITEWKAQPADQYVLGIDLGWYDHTAFSLISWSPAHDKVIELESYREREMLLDKVAARIRMYMDEYQPLYIVGDPGRRQAFEELRQRYDLPISPAEKSDKLHWIDMINTDFAAGKIAILNAHSSPHVEEMLDLTWEKRPSNKRIESPSCANDASDAFLYAFRYARHYLHKPQKEAPTLGTPEYWAEQENKIEHEQEEYYRYGRKRGPWG